MLHKKQSSKLFQGGKYCENDDRHQKYHLSLS